MRRLCGHDLRWALAAPRRRLVVAALGGMLLALVVLAGPGSGSALALTVTTPYPAISVQAGQTVTLDLTVADTVAGRADLSVKQVPSGWTVNIRGDGRPVSAVITSPDNPPSMQLQVIVPKDAAANTYTMSVEARGTSGTVSLPITFTVGEDVGGSTTLESDYTSLRGPSGATFQFTLNLSNGTSQPRTYNISASGPNNWTLTLRPAGSDKETPSVVVQPQGTQVLTLNITPPPDVTVGSFNVVVQASGGGEELAAPLVVEITGTYKLTLTTPDQRLNANVKAGTTTRVPMILTNSGTGPLQGVQLSATPPTNWEVTFEPASIDVLPPDQQMTVTAVFKPAKDAIAGDYVVTMDAQADQAYSSADIRVTVKTSTLWGLVGILIAVAAIGILVLVFRRFGHR